MCDEWTNGRCLALSIVRATIVAHGGKIWADSPGIGLGTTFFCTLPFTPPLETEPLHSIAFENAMGSSPGGPLTLPRTGPLRQSEHSKIVVVENDMRIVRYLRAHLQEQ